SDILREQERELDTLSEAVTTRGVSILADMNGSARSLSIDSDFLSSLGVSFTAINNTPRRFAHRIVPEGESLEPCRLALKKAREHDPSYEFGYVPDCDGDRGNFVYWNDDDGEAYSLEAQDSFALAVLAELATTVANASRDGKAAPRMAVACNDATSLRVEAIAGAFGARVFRAETGEANVVGLARSLREQGYEVRVLGEGSNGGVITHPASVRDPLNTTTAILKLLYLRDLEDDAKRAPGPFRLWLERTGRADDYHEQFAMCDVLASLPRFATTSVFEPRAALTVRTRNHAALKGAYEPLFRAAWPVIAAELEPVYGPLTWQAYASAGSGEHELTGGFAESGTGGLRIVFYDGQGVPAGFLWMRGSGTEPVFRIMADLRGDDGTLESLVLERHTALVREADSLVI
ncbi:MAG: phosphatidylglycerol lysyltransferase, partial [Spirochaetales bacterium]|nr:phosphatidylglycerol lysyltransferase [Spirochaetales bacterium]